MRANNLKSISAVRNDRNKKRKPKQDTCISPQQSTELSHEEEEIVDKIARVHEETFPITSGEEKYTLVSLSSGLSFNIKTYFRYGDLHDKNKMVSPPSYQCHNDPFTGKI